MARRWPALSVLLVMVVHASCPAPSLGRRVRVGDHRMQVHLEGRGEPVVVFDAGLGDPMQVWTWVWPDVAKLTRVCLYDRAGLGRSDPGPLPRTSARMVSELRALLAATAAESPYVLVGHSLGGLNAMLFAREHPEEVAGLVLVDPTPPEYPDHEAARRSAAERRKLETNLALAPPAVEEELEAVSESAAEVRVANPFPLIPVIVLSAGRPDAPSGFRHTWARMQAELAAELHATKHVVVEGSGHYVQFDRPDLVVEAIREVVERVRATAPQQRRSPRPARARP